MDSLETMMVDNIPYAEPNLPISAYEDDTGWPWPALNVIMSPQICIELLPLIPLQFARSGWCANLEVC